MYRACAACHSLEPNRNMTGPSLAEVWNRKAGSLASFPRYSPALKSAGIIWNDDTLDEWIKDPQQGFSWCTHTSLDERGLIKIPALACFADSSRTFRKG
jgi:cytochrome c2